MTDTVSDAAVEAAASAMWDHDRERWDDDDVIGKWDAQEAEVKASWRPMARAALEAAAPLIAGGEMAWQPISTYPNCEMCGEDACDWGPTVTVLVPTPWCESVPMTAHLEAGTWLVRDSDDLRAWGGLVEVEPTHWAQIPAIRADKGGEP